ncbi:phosphatase [Tenacibaculum sp. AHE15PA]|uniref:PhoX family protein n=1 Tax=unclassified Tenacibaculum TaxID=2635139 RepID=UPI001C4E4673|nr:MULTISPECIES: PhoX family protein [unclassified Tenacibaculum]QXP74583.1 phosphatase [Tenacibaculum sp. AHE14PA]QXP76094.1 phosphatase [Tenacibaculum sp. AHE15PA]
MKNLKLSVLTLLTAFIGLTTFTACQDGVDGANGIDGVDGSNGADGNNGSDATASLNTSKTPNFLKVRGEFVGLKITPILSSEDVIPNSPDFVYGSMADGAGLLPESDGTFTLINNIEADYAIARIKLNENLKPLSGEYILNASATGETAQCSGSMISPEEHGFGPLYLSGGEWGGASKGVFVTDPYKSPTDASAGNMLPAFGQWSTENAVLIGKDAYSDKTVAFIGDDNSDNNVPSGQLGMYVGDRGDLNGGKLYGLKVTSPGVTYEVDMAEGTEYDVEFVELEEKEINALDTECKTKGVMGFSRLEDIDWRRGSAANNREIYFAVTGRNKPGLVGKGSILGRVYKVVLNDTDPTGNAKITCVLDGDIVGGKADGFHSPDNILVTENYAYIQEDPNGYASVNPNIIGYSKLYQYNLTTGAIKTVLECDQERAASLGYGTTSRNWEITGMIDVTDIVNNGKNSFLVMTQNHGWEPADGTSFTDPKANPNLENRKEGSVLHLITGLER